MESTNSSEQAAKNAQIAATAASETATAIALVGNDVNWMKRSLSSIELKLDEMSKSFITSAQHADALKTIGDHEIRIVSLEKSNIRQTVTVGIGIAIMGLLVSIMIWHIMGR